VRTTIKECVREGGDTLEAAAEKLNIAKRTMEGYAYKDDAPVDIIMAMAEVYNAPELPLMYCADRCPIGRSYIPQVEKTNCPQAALRVFREIKDVVSAQVEMIQIHSDGRLTEDEIPTQEQIIQEMTEAIQAMQTYIVNVRREIGKVKKANKKAAPRWIAAM
jgi:hypothetical protein